MTRTREPRRCVTFALVAARSRRDCGPARAGRAQYAVTGMVLKVDRRPQDASSCRIEAIPGLHGGDDDAVRGPRAQRSSTGLVPGAIVAFTLVVDRELVVRRAHPGSCATRAWSRIRWPPAG